MIKQNNYSNYEDFKSQKFLLSIGLICAVIDQCNFTPRESRAEPALLVLSGVLSQIILMHPGSESSLL